MTAVDLPLFVYGTLMFPEVLYALLGRVPHAEPATAPGWRAAALAGRPYPGLVQADRATRGLLLLDLRAEERRTLDAFEDSLYDLRLIELADGRPAGAYIWRDPQAVLDHDWDPDHFAATALADYT